GAPDLARPTHGGGERGVYEDAGGRAARSKGRTSADASDHAGRGRRGGTSQGCGGRSGGQSDQGSGAQSQGGAGQEGQTRSQGPRQAASRGVAFQIARQATSRGE